MALFICKLDGPILDVSESSTGEGGVGVFVMPFVGQFEGCDGMNGMLKR